MGSKPQDLSCFFKIHKMQNLVNNLVVSSNAEHQYPKSNDILLVCMLDYTHCLQLRECHTAIKFNT